jgi:hypothetical protein
MSSLSELESFSLPLPKTMKECKSCQQITTHHIYSGEGLRATVCARCLARATAFELTRD